MWQLASAVGEIVLRRRGPESLPDSNFLVAFLLVISVLLSLVALFLYGQLTILKLEEFAAQVIPRTSLAKILACVPSFRDEPGGASFSVT